MRKTRNAVHISVSGRVEVPVEFADTGHPFLDSRPMKHPKDLHVSDLFLKRQTRRVVGDWLKSSFHHHGGGQLAPCRIRLALPLNDLCGFDVIRFWSKGGDIFVALWDGPRIESASIYGANFVLKQNEDGSRWLIHDL